jgi:uncharacterized protein
MRNLCLFPLHTVLFPGMPLPLHIFEPRYLEMINQCIEDNNPFGVLLIHQGLEALGPLANPYSIGCTANIVQVDQVEDGRLNIMAIGEERFRVHKLNRDKPYLTGLVEVMPMDIPQTLNVIRGVRQLKPWINSYLHLLSSIGDEDLELNLNLYDLPEDPLMLLYMAAALLQVPSSERQALLESETANHLLYKITRIYRRELAVFSTLRDVSPERANYAAWLN